MKLFQKLSLAVAVCLLAVTGVRAEDATVNPAGTWNVTIYVTNTAAQVNAYSLKLATDGATLTGTLSNVSTVNGVSHTYDWPISEGKISDHDLSFTVTHPFEVGNGDVTSVYHGKINGDTIQGDYTESYLGNTSAKHWIALREKGTQPMLPSSLLPAPAAPPK